VSPIGYYDRQGRPISLEEYCRTFTPDRSPVARTTVGHVTVSTVWLGLDHQFGDGPPLIFETMVFGAELDEHQWRYATEGEALLGHQVAVAEVKATAAQVSERS
jgi:hypothetical protein